MKRLVHKPVNPPWLMDFKRVLLLLRCMLQQHTWDVHQYEDDSTYAVCRRCKTRVEPQPRTDGCTAVWDPQNNAYKCRHSSNLSARSWGGLCPRHARLKHNKLLRMSHIPPSKNEKHENDD